MILTPLKFNIENIYTQFKPPEFNSNGYIGWSMKIKWIEYKKNKQKMHCLYMTVEENEKNERKYRCLFRRKVVKPTQARTHAHPNKHPSILVHSWNCVHLDIFERNSYSAGWDCLSNKFQYQFFLLLFEIWIRKESDYSNFWITCR